MSSPLDDCRALAHQKDMTYEFYTFEDGSTTCTIIDPATGYAPDYVPDTSMSDPMWMDNPLIVVGIFVFIIALAMLINYIREVLS